MAGTIHAWRPLRPYTVVSGILDGVDMARSDVAIKFFPTAQLLGPISRDRTGPVEHPLVGPAKGFYRCATIIEEGEGALLKAPGSVLPDIDRKSTRLNSRN